jgi:hypothetical protein
MKGVVIRSLAASMAALVWSSSGLAEEAPGVQVTPAPPPPAPTVRVEPPTVIVAPPRRTITYEERTPNVGLIGSGVLMFGISYGTSMIVGAASDRPADQALFVPVAGPFIDIATRTNDCRGGACAANEVANRVLLVTSGLFQAGGVIQILAGFLVPQVRVVTRTAGLPAGFHVAPSGGRGSVGISASGAF